MTVKRNAIYRIISAVLIMCSAAIPVQADWSKDSLGNWTKRKVDFQDLYMPI